MIADGARPAEFWTGVVFRNNSAIGDGAEGVRGGAVSMGSGQLIAVGTIFSGNMAEGNMPWGGAFSADFAAASTRLINALFESNTVLVRRGEGYGGALHLEASVGELRLEGGVLRRNVARMDSSMASQATAGGVSVGAKGKLTLQGTQLSANAAGGQGNRESSVAFATQAKENRKVRAAHIDSLGSVTIEGCVFEGTQAGDSAERRAAAPWLIVGRHQAPARRQQLRRR